MEEVAPEVNVKLKGPELTASLMAKENFRHRLRHNTFTPSPNHIHHERG
jgi:hypothetical protein